MSCSSCGDSSCGSSGDCNSCNGPKVIITKQGLNGINGHAILFSNHSEEQTAIGTFALTDVPNMDYLVPAGTFAQNGDVLEINSLVTKRVQSGTWNVAFYFNGQLISYDLTGVLQPSDVTIMFKGKVTRISNTEVSIEGVLNVGSGATDVLPTQSAPTISFFHRYNKLTSLDLVANEYLLKMAIEGDTLSNPMYTRYFTVEKKYVII